MDVAMATVTVVMVPGRSMLRVVVVVGSTATVMDLVSMSTSDETLPQQKQSSDDEFVFSVISNETEGNSTWLLGSGASCHVSGMLDDFSDYRQLDTPISVMAASVQRLQARGFGQVRMILADGCSVKLTEGLYVPHLESKLVPVSALTAHGVLIHFDTHATSLMIDEKVIARTPRIDERK
ncbi:polyprotein [Plasmopara halstedii]|uniref:Polyprotein n=1 Tax=Plasmopara halstedii TaxID=4781 RepID=A0A0P1A603_PLAHL|nr:polyprotein [Plasmopara halstedii]CEG35469.1 polyprotein [Plasmopara halstedii]|eukprot:XP_024571838.1 polyprotein [Plasmopara halstedii]